jgi:nucleoside-diphosphate-sugar epimerase
MEGTVLVAGASGYVGGRLIPILLQQGVHVRALSRRPDRNEIVVRDDSARRILPIPLTSFDESVRSALAREQ